jgi:hypothetical protein
MRSLNWRANFDAIASKFTRLFSDRMVQKRELMDRVHGGGDLSELLTPEVDEGVDVPMVSQMTSTPLSQVRAATARPASKFRRIGFFVAFLLAVGLGGGVGGFLRWRAKQQKSSPVAAVVATDASVAAVTPPPAGSGDTPTPPAPAGAEYIVISIDTDPEGVRIIVAGEERGKTPIDVRVKKAGEPVDVQLVAPGFTATAQQVVPDRDQRLYFQLVKQQKTIVRIKKPPEKRGSGFRRFD